MTSWNIEPQKGVGPLRFGMSLGAIEAILGPKWHAFNRAGDKNSQVLAFDKQSLHVLLDSNGELKQVTVFRPNKVILSGIQLADEKLSWVSGALAELGMDFQPVDAGLWDEDRKILLIDLDGYIDGVEVLNGGE